MGMDAASGKKEDMTMAAARTEAAAMRCAIFDMDGTLVDSMGFWDELAGEYLRERGVDPVPQEILERIKPMTMAETAAVFRRELGLQGTVESIAADMSALMDGHYHRDVPLKPGVEDYIRALHRRGVKMCVASATPEHLMRICLERLGVLELFQFVLSCDAVRAGKDRPDVYDEAARRMGAPGPQAVTVYEDAVYAGRTAKAAGYRLAALYDGSGAAHWEELKAMADVWAMDFRELMEKEGLS